MNSRILACLMIACGMLLNGRPQFPAEAAQTGSVAPMVQAATRFSAIAAGVFHSLALKTNGAVVAWGDNKYGQTSVPTAVIPPIAEDPANQKVLAQVQDDWTLRNPLIQGGNLSRVIYANGSYVAVGNGGTTATSSDALTWTGAKTGPPSAVAGALAFGNGVFVRAQYDPLTKDSAVLTAPDGFAWTFTGTRIPGFLSAIAYGNGRFVGAGGWTSTDAITWAPASSGGLAVAFGNGIFVGVGGDTILTSVDGLTWTKRSWSYTSPCFSCGFDGLSEVVYANEMFLVHGLYRQSVIMQRFVLTSRDGVTWTPASSEAYIPPNSAFGNGVWVSVSVLRAFVTGTSGTIEVGGIIEKRSLSDTSRQTVALPNAPLYGVAHGSAGFVAVGSGGIILTSADGENWSNRSGSVDNLHSVTGDDDGFVAVGNGGAILTSGNGRSWISQESGTNHLFAITRVNGTYIAVGTAILTSPDGKTWTTNALRPSGTLTGIAHGNGIYVTVGTELVPFPGGIGFTSVARVYSSTDSVNWTNPVAGFLPASSLSRIAFGNGTFVALGGEKILTSIDGATWSAQVSGLSSENGFVSRIVYGAGIFVGVTDRGRIVTSADGITWVVRFPVAPEGQSSLLRTFFPIAFADGRFVVAQVGSLVTSTDGITWTEWFAPSLNGITSLGYAQGTFVAVGASGTILQAAKNSLWDPRPILTAHSQAEVGGFELGLRRKLKSGHRVQASVDLQTWADLVAITNTLAHQQFLDTGATNFSQRFYRAVTP